VTGPPPARPNPPQNPGSPATRYGPAENTQCITGWHLNPDMGIYDKLPESVERKKRNAATSDGIDQSTHLRTNPSGVEFITRL